VNTTFNNDDDDDDSFTRLLRSNRKLEEFRLLATGSGGDIAALALSHALRFRSSLRRIYLQNCGLSLVNPMTRYGDSLPSLCKNLKELQELESLELQVGDRGAAIVGDFIAGHATLKLLHLYDDEMTDTGFQSVGAGLERNSTLVSLYLGDILQLSDNAFRSIIDGIKDHPSIREADVSHGLNQAQTAELAYYNARNAGPRQLLAKSPPLGVLPYALERAMKHSYVFERRRFEAPVDLVYYIIREKHVELLSNQRRSRKRAREARGSLSAPTVWVAMRQLGSLRRRPLALRTLQMLTYGGKRIRATYNSQLSIHSKRNHWDSILARLLLAVST
jgi:hypothetical protein